MSHFSREYCRILRCSSCSLRASRSAPSNLIDTEPLCCCRWKVGGGDTNALSAAGLPGVQRASLNHTRLNLSTVASLESIVNLFVSYFVRPSVPLFIHPPVLLYVCLFVHPSVRLSVSLSIYTSICPYVLLSVCLLQGKID